VSNFQWVWIYSCWKLARRDHNLSVRMDEKRSLQRKSKHKRRDLRRATRTVAKGLKCALKLMVGFLNTYCELLPFIEIIYITNKCNQYVICLSFVHFVRLFIRNIQTALSPHSLKIGHMCICTYLLRIVHNTTT